MPDETDSAPIRWRLHLAAAPQTVHTLLATDLGRARFWAESADERQGVITWRFPDGTSLTSRIIANEAPGRFVVEYVGSSIATFELAEDGAGGTDLMLTDSGVSQRWTGETAAGWVSVLMALKAAVDFGIDLRNHDAARTWDHGFVDN